MAYFQSYTFSTANVFLQNLATFLSENGWIVDFSGTYNTSWYRVHFHQGEAHFDLVSSSATLINGYGCTGYAPGSAPAAQPGASAAGKTFTGVSGKGYRFVSTVGGIYIGITNASDVYTWGACFRVLDKIGSWPNGFGIQGEGAASFFSINAHIASGYAQLYYNEGWSTYGSGPGGFCGNCMANDLTISQPCSYNGAIIPLKTLFFIRNATNSTLLHPIGYAPGLYRANCGDIYVVGDEIIIGADTFKIFPTYAAALGDTNYHDLLFKLGA